MVEPMKLNAAMQVKLKKIRSRLTLIEKDLKNTEEITMIATKK
jgi:hypothetical protein